MIHANRNYMFNISSNKKERRPTLQAPAARLQIILAIQLRANN